jgi:hypothetical protein
MVNKKHERTREERVDQVGHIIRNMNELGLNWNDFKELLPVHEEMRHYIESGYSFTGSFGILSSIGGRKKEFYMSLNNHRLKECISVVKDRGVWDE